MKFYYFIPEVLSCIGSGSGQLKCSHSPKNNEYCEDFIMSLWYCIVEHFFSPAEVCLALNTYLCEHYM
jgi:hypothetical protein